MHDEDVVNPTDNRPFNDVLAARLSRRAALGGAAATTAAAFLTPSFAAAQDTAGGAGAAAAGGRPPSPLMDFEPIPLGFGPEPSISPDYRYDVMAPWGTPLSTAAPDWNYPPTAEAQAQQVGIGHDGMWYFPARRNGNRGGLLCINHEFGRNSHVYGKPGPESLDDVRAMQNAMGVTVARARISNRTGKWEINRRSRRNRRITVNTPVEFAGPVAGSHLLENKAGNEPAGTINNCANGYTPWGTYLTCEENFNGYFGTNDEKWTPNDAQARYGFNDGGFGYDWHSYDERFDLANHDYENEHNRFGWVVEINPQNPNQKPIKRTALGRFKHEGVAITVGKGGRVVAYMGDDQRFDYIYKFVSEDNWWSMAARGRHPLDHGALYVARFDDDGTGEWVELTIKDPRIAKEMGSQEEVLVNARIAADLVGATPMDRPEWGTVAKNGDVFMTCTNNTNRTEPNAANPEAPNPNGHILKWHDSKKHTGTDFEWDIFIQATDTLGTDDAFTDPDGLWADEDGRLFIQTDGGQPDGANNQMLVCDTTTGEIRRLFAGVAGDEITGIAVTPDRKTMFINTQHPGNGDPTLTNFPAPTDGVTVPRDCTIVITKKDGGVIGS